MTLVLSCARGDWTIEEADEKLAFRATLPGAFGYDQAAQLLRALQADGVPALELLPVAFPTSWMVNARATSSTFRRWMATPALEHWDGLLSLLAADASLESWSSGAIDRAAVAAHVTALSSVEGAGLAAVSKVLALLRPQLVPLMDDAAVAFAIGAVPMPNDEQATAGPEVFAPMLDWFAAQVLRGEKELVAIAARHRQAVLDAAQTLDRLSWMDAFGNRYRAIDGTRPAFGGSAIT